MGNLMKPLNPADKLVKEEVDFASILPSGALIASIAGVSVSPAAELTATAGEVTSGKNGTNTAVTIYLSGGTAGTTYTVTITVNLNEVVGGVTAQFARNVMVPIADV